MFHHTTMRGRRRGQVMIVMAACLPVLCIIAAATVDVGHLCATKTQLQNAADAAAVAAVMQMWKTRSAALSESAARTAAIGEACTIADLNCGSANGYTIMSIPVTSNRHPSSVSIHVFSRAMVTR